MLSPANTDRLLRFLFDRTSVRGEIVHLDDTWQAVLARHDYPLPVRQVLGELLAAGALLAATLKFNGSIILQIQGAGPLTLAVVECTSERTLRATAQWEGDLHGDTLAQLIGNGRFVITIDPKESTQRYQGIVAIEGGGVAQALENYLARSEQIQSRMWLAVDDARAAGLLLQKMPDIAGGDADDWDRLTHLADTIQPAELLGISQNEVLHRLFHEETVRLFDPEPLRFRCTCSRDRVANALRLLGYDEVHSILEEQGGIDVDCEFCGEHYRFDPIDAEQVFAASVMTEAPPGQH
jgi:molecular chaperone Hsp33